MRGRGVFLKLPIAAALAWAPIAGVSARAGAFLQAEGSGQVITTFRHSRADASFDAAGRVQKGGLYTKSELQAYAEYGVTEWMTLVFSPTLQHFSSVSAHPPIYDGLGDSEAGVRIGTLAFGPVVLSAQVGATTHGDIAGFGHRRLTGQPGAQADLRVLAGLGFACWAWACFADAQAAFRPASRNAEAQWRVEATLGVRPMPDVLVLVQAFSSIAPATAKAGASQTHKLQLSLVYDFWQRYSVQIGGFAGMQGRNAPREAGIISAFWYRF